VEAEAFDPLASAPNTVDVRTLWGKLKFALLNWGATPGGSANFSLQKSFKSTALAPAVGEYLRTAVNLTLMERESRPGRRPVYWVTPVIRDQLWDEVYPEDRPRLHARAFDWYEAQRGQTRAANPEYLAEAVFHALAAGNVRGACDLAIDLGKYLKDMLLYQEAIEVERQAAERLDADVIAAAVQDRDGTVTTLLNNLGGSYWRMGDARAAIAYFEQALAIDREASGERHPAVATGLNNLGAAWQELGEPRKAMAYYEQALAINREVYGERHPDVATRLNNLGSAWYALGEHQKAIAYLEQALEIFTAVYGPEHPLTRRVQSNLDGITAETRRREGQ